MLSVEKEGVIIAVHIQPRASKNEVCGLHGSELKIRLTSPPVDGAANRLCQEFLSCLFDLSRSRISIKSGDKSRHKRILLEGVTRDQIADKLKLFDL